MRTQSGFTTFTVTLILLLILLAVTLLVGKLLVADRRITLNETLYRQVMALAEQGLSYGFGRLSAEGSSCPSLLPVWSGNSFSPSGADGTYTLTVECITPFPVVTGSTTLVAPIRIRSVANLSDSQAQAAVEAQYVQNNVLAGTPAAPLTVAGGMAVGGNFTVVANPNGGGPGVPLSIWTNDYVDLNTGSGQTCHQGDYAGGCSANISQPGSKQSDIKDSDPDFPTDLVWYLFNENDDDAGWANIESRANQIVTSCNGLGPTTTGLIIVDGDCSPGSNIGTQAAPVVLIIRDGNLTINGNRQLFGLVFAYASDPATTTADIKLTGGAIVNGALAANFKLGNSNGTYDAKYDEAALSNIRTGAAFQTLKQVPGSWRDW
ncbi:PilX N-terminal domain-containing pilus assembly protein [Aeromonas media]|uniref:PilX N-terminal domain-containing pilus assembly protein n=1 Tax=Aeromonas media TaxID=651 RepID=UPI001922056E|nr:PilX N-terminal domain-containing pilus assembly protein [Aeromonas media]MBL0514250.1 hypothetical protein [Aeromonas media]